MRYYAKQFIFIIYKIGPFLSKRQNFTSDIGRNFCQALYACTKAVFLIVRTDWQDFCHQDTWPERPDRPIIGCRAEGLS